MSRSTAASWCSTFSVPSLPDAEAHKEELTPDTPFHQRPGSVLGSPEVPYFCLPDGAAASSRARLCEILSKTPLPLGAAEFSSLHIVSAAEDAAASEARLLQQSAQEIGKAARLYAWPALERDDVDGEYEAFFGITSEMILHGADRASLLVFVAGTGGSECMAIAAILGMLPFRGVQVALLTREAVYVDPLARMQTPSGLFEYSAQQPERMGRRPLAAIFGPLPNHVFSGPLGPWRPLEPAPLVPEEKPAPFKIGGLELPMVTFEGRYEAGVERLTSLLSGHFGASHFPVVSVGETGDALGYGADLHASLASRGCAGYYFAHASGESYKRPDAYGKPELLAAIAGAKRSGRRVVVVAVGGGVNGNAMGMIAALTGSDFVEVPTTLMHYNDATTSAKKAFSLVVDGRILSKNILGTFYLPQLVFCVSEVFLTLSSCSVHAAVGEAAKTMSMLGRASSQQGQVDFHNILGASEFASDFTRVVQTVPGFEQLILFLQGTSGLKGQILAAGRAIRARTVRGEGEDLEVERRGLLQKLREEFHQDLAEQERRQVTEFLTVINEEVIRAKAMFLAYSDPFEKYRALLFEYAHTLGHGVEAFMNDLYRRAEAAGIDYSEAFRLHGQCVGMAVTWAGEMSLELGHLEGPGYLAHQGLVYLFNRFGGFDFLPLRRLCDELDVSKAEFCEGVLRVVRRDNKRGYCRCEEGSSVDQLVRNRPGCLVRSADPSAELRYLVEVSEESQRCVLEEAFDGAYDRVAVVHRLGAQGKEPALALVARADAPIAGKGDSQGHPEASAPAAEVAAALDALIRRLYL